MKKLLALLVVLAVAFGAWWMLRKTPQLPAGEVVVIALEGQPATVDPVGVVDVHSSMVATAVHAPLAWIAGDGSIIPMAAESMSLSADAKELKVVASKAVAFWDGSRIRAQDIAYSLERYRNSPNLHRWILDRVQGIADFDATKATHIPGIEITDESSLTIHFAEPEPDAAFLLSNLSVAIVKEGSGEKPIEPFGVQVIGCGPYVPGTFEPGSFRCKLRIPNPDQPAELLFRTIPDDQARLEGFKQGELAWLRLRGPMISEATESTAKGITVQKWVGRGKASIYPANELNYLIYNWESPALKGIPAPSRRSTLLKSSAAVDREKLADKLAPGGLAEATASIAPPSSGVPALAQLTPPAAGTPGQPANLTLLAANDSASRQFAIAVQTAWRERGVEIKTEFVDLGKLVERLVKKDFEIMLFWIELQVPSSGPYAWCCFFDKNAPLSAFGEAREDTGALLAQARGAVEAGERAKRFAQVVELIDARQSSWLPLLSRKAVVLHDLSIVPWFDRNGTPVNGLIRRK